jgi:ribonuclease R
VHVSTLVDDLYLFRERSHSLVGQRTGRAFRLGDLVRVRADRVDRGRHLIDFSVVEGGTFVAPPAAGAERRPPRRGPRRAR